MQHVHRNISNFHFHYRIHRLREVGIMQVVYKRHTSYSEKDETLIRAMSFSETWFIFAICGIGIIVGIIILCVEQLN